MTKTILFLVATSLAACGSKDQPSAAVAAGNPAVAAKPSADIEPHSITYSELTITADAPKGWTEAKLGPSTTLYSDPAGSIYPSTMMLSEDCAGDCATIPANLKKALQSQVELHKGAGYSNVEVIASGDLPGGGVEYELKVSKPEQEPFYQYTRLAFQDGWTHAAGCTGTAVGRGIAYRDMLRAACKGMKAVKK
jgi:hypothetical protein